MEIQFVTLDELRNQILEAQNKGLEFITNEDKELFKKHCELTEFIKFKDGKPNSFYTKPNCGTIYAYKLHQFPELKKLKNKMVKNNVGTYCNSIGLQTQCLDKF